MVRSAPSGRRTGRRGRQVTRPFRRSTVDSRWSIAHSVRLSRRFSEPDTFYERSWHIDAGSVATNSDGIRNAAILLGPASADRIRPSINRQDQNAQLGKALRSARSPACSRQPAGRGAPGSWSAANARIPALSCHCSTPSKAGGTRSSPPTPHSATGASSTWKPGTAPTPALRTASASARKPASAGSRPGCSRSTKPGSSWPSSASTYSPGPKPCSSMVTSPARNPRNCAIGCYTSQPASPAPPAGPDSPSPPTGPGPTH